jgi:2-methylisocitrate lyase-like PEP mutase family enzyme
VREVAEMGVRRLTVGPHLAKVAFTAMRRACAELLTEGTYERLFVAELSVPELNGMFAARPAVG